MNLWQIPLISTYIFILVNEHPNILRFKDQLKDKIEVLICKARPRSIYKLENGKDVIIMRDLEADVLDFVSNMCIHIIESGKLRKKISAPLTLEKVIENARDLEKLATEPYTYNPSKKPSRFIKELAKQVVVPEGIVSLRRDAFRGFTNMEAISLPNSLKFLGEEVDIYDPDSTYKSPIARPMNTFRDCGKLKEITIPENVKLIPAEVFRDCESLNTINILSSDYVRFAPASILYIGNNSFKIYMKPTVKNVKADTKEFNNFIRPHIHLKRSLGAVTESVEDEVKDNKDISTDVIVICKKNDFTTTVNHSRPDYVYLEFKYNYSGTLSHNEATKKHNKVREEIHNELGLDYKDFDLSMGWDGYDLNITFTYSFNKNESLNEAEDNSLLDEVEVEDNDNELSKYDEIIFLADDEVEAIEGYDKAIAFFEECDCELKDEVIEKLQHIKSEEIEHIKELKELIINLGSDKLSDKAEEIIADLEEIKPESNLEPNTEVIDNLEEGYNVNSDKAVENATKALKKNSNYYCAVYGFAQDDDKDIYYFKKPICFKDAQELSFFEDKLDAYLKVVYRENIE